MCIMTKTFGFCVKIKEIAKFFTNILRFSYLRIFKIFKLIRKYLFSCEKLHDLHVYFSEYISCTFICFNKLRINYFSLKLLLEMFRKFAQEKFAQIIKRNIKKWFSIPTTKVFRSICTGILLN